MVMPVWKDYYEILGVPEDASQEEIERAYKELVRKYHPDLAPPDKKEEYTKKMQEINEAYAVLSDPEKRAKYDSGQWMPLSGMDKILAQELFELHDEDWQKLRRFMDFWEEMTADVMKERIEEEEGELDEDDFLRWIEG